MDRKGRGLILLGVLALAAVGQYYFAKKPDYFWDGVAFYAVAVALFLTLVRQPSRRVKQAEPSGKRLTPDVMIRGLLVGAALLLGLIVVLQLTLPQKDYWPMFWLWIAAMSLYLLAFLPIHRRLTAAPPDREDAAVETIPAWSPEGAMPYEIPPGRRQVQFKGPSPLRSAHDAAEGAAYGWELGLLLLLLAGAFLLRAWRIDAIPWTLGGDEGSQGLWARAVIEGRLTNMFGLGWLSVPNISFYWQAAWLKLFGDNMVGLRLPWAVVGTLTVLGTYLLVRRLFDRGLAFLTAFLLATYHYHIHYSRLGSNQVADPLFAVWALYFLVIGWQSSAAESPWADPTQERSLVRPVPTPPRDRRWAWALSGIIAGLAFFFYAGSRLVPVILLACLAWAVLTEHDFLRQQARNLLVMLGGFLVTIGPMAQLAIRDPDNFNARVNQMGLFQSGLIDRIAAQTGGSRLSVLVEQFRRAFFAFNFFKDRVRWYGPLTIPLMDFLASIFFVLGLAVSVARMLKWRYAAFVIWFVLVMTLGGALTENPPSSQRLVSSAIPAVFFVAVALRELTKALAESIALPEFGRRAVAAGVACVLALLSVRYYFGPYQASWVYGGFNGEVATRIGYYLESLGPEWQEYFFGAPRMYADFGSIPFIAKGVELHDVQQPLTRPPDFVDPSRKPVFIFLPERVSELEWVRRTYPHGILEEVRRIDNPEGPLLFTAYRPTL